MILAHPHRSARRRSAFTLLEVLVVVAIILVLASVATVAVLQVQAQNKNDIARLKAITIEKAFKTYVVRHDGNEPQGLADVAQYIDGDPGEKIMDPWNKEYQYKSEPDPETGNTRYVVFTFAPDGTEIRSDQRTPQK